MAAKGKLSAVPTRADEIMDPEGEYAVMGNQRYVIRELPVARLKRFKSVWFDFFGSVTELLRGGDITDSAVTTAFFGLLEDKPGQMLDIIIPGFDHALLADEDNGVTIPQLMHALDRSISINGLDFVRRAMPFLTQVGGNAVQLRLLTALKTKAEQAEEDDATEKTS